MFIDTHCHLDDPKLKDDLIAVVNEFKACGVGRVINIGCDVKSSELVKEQAEQFEEVYFAAGLHPMDIKDLEISAIYDIKGLLDHEKCVAVGEIGLDYYWDKSYSDKQKEFFVAQLELACAAGLPVNLHIRDAMGDACKILRENRDKLRYGGIMHCYSGSIESAKELMKLGLYISFGGSLTFKNARNIKEVAAAVPREYILTETDSPFLAPEPFRGTVNAPKRIPVIAEKLAEIRGEDIGEVETYVYENAKRLFSKLK